MDKSSAEARPSSGERVVYVDRLKHGMQRIVTDRAFRQRFEENPAELLPEIGIQLPDKEQAALIGKSVSELLPVAQRAVPNPQIISVTVAFTVTQSL